MGMHPRVVFSSVHDLRRCETKKRGDRDTRALAASHWEKKRITGRLFVAAHPVLARPDAALAELRHAAHFVVDLEVTAGQRTFGLHQVDLALRFRVLLHNSCF